MKGEEAKGRHARMELDSEDEVDVRGGEEG